MKNITIIEGWRGKINASYAHNSVLYRHFAEGATAAEIISFLAWDSEQPPFYKYLQSWQGKAPVAVSKALQKHIDEEVNEDHTGLFKSMRSALESHFGKVSVEADAKVLEDLNYTFSPACALREDFAFFAGGFYATEIMSAKRCEQLMTGLKRLGFPLSQMKYLELHAVGDQTHSSEIESDFLAPLLSETSPAAIERGITDRLVRSERYLRWYESR